MRRAGRSRWGRLLKAGVRIYEYTPTTLHTKIMIVDGLWSSVGSTNFDNRSFRLNDEANLNVFDETFASHQLEYVERDFAQQHVAECIGAVAVDGLAQVELHAGALGKALTAQLHEPMRPHLLG